MRITLDHFLPHFLHPFVTTEVTLELPSGDGVTGQVFEGVLGDIPTVRKPGIYVIYVKPTAQFYFGSTANLYERLIAHGYTLNQGTHKNRYFRKLNRNHPEFLIEYKAFVVENRELAYDIEQLLVDKMWGSPNLMNVCRNVRSAEGYEHDVETIEKMRKHALSRCPMSNEIKARISKTLKGRTLDSTHATNLSEANKEKWSDPEFRKRWMAKKAVKALVDDIIYDSVSHAARAHSIGITTAFRRINSDNPKFSNWQYAQ